MIARAFGLLLLALLCAVPASARAADSHGAHGATGTGPNIDPLDAAKDLADKTLNAVVYLPQVDNPSSLKTVMFQAYLRPDGSALVRAWDPVANRYSPTDTRPWRGDRDTVCLTVPAFALPEPLCIALHSWGPAFAGSGINFQAMIKGDVRQGAALN